MPIDSLERLFNSQADAATAISTISKSEDRETESWLEGTAVWAHQKSRHLGEKATYRWAQERGIPLTGDMIKQVIQKSDNGSHFTGKEIKQFALENNIEWVYHMPYYPQAAGLIERMNGLLKGALKKNDFRW